MLSTDGAGVLWSLVWCLESGWVWQVSCLARVARCRITRSSPRVVGPESLRKPWSCGMQAMTMVWDWGSTGNWTTDYSSYTKQHQTFLQPPSPPSHYYNGITVVKNATLQWENTNNNITNPRMPYPQHCKPTTATTSPTWESEWCQVSN